MISGYVIRLGGSELRSERIMFEGDFIATAFISCIISQGHSHNSKHVELATDVSP